MSDPEDFETFVPRRELDVRFNELKADIASLKAQHQDDMKILRNGAQASLNTSFQLNGDSTFGIEGFIPQVNRQIKELYTQGEHRDEKLAEVRAEQLTIKRTLEYIAKFFRMLGKIADWKVWVLGVVAVIIYLFPTLRSSQLVNMFEKFLHGGAK